MPWILSAVALVLALSLWALTLWNQRPRSAAESPAAQVEAPPPKRTPRRARATPPAAVVATQPVDGAAAPDETRIALPIYPPFTQQEAEILFSIGPNEVFDPLCGKLYRPSQRIAVQILEHPERTLEFVINSRSMREEAEPAAQKPRLRVLVAGDSQAEGACRNDESFAALAKAGLKRRELSQSRRLGTSFDPNSIEVLNACKGGHSFFSYLGVLEKHLDLSPDVFVVAVNGGNDFDEALSIWHFLQRSERPPGRESYHEQVEAATRVYRGALGQALLSVKYFDVNPGQKSVAVAAAKQVFDHIRALCDERGIRLLVIYLPPRQDVEADNPQMRLDSLLEALQSPREALLSTSEMADGLLNHLQAAGIETIDLRVPFRLAAEPLYWKADWQLNLAGHRLVTQHLLPALNTSR